MRGNIRESLPQPGPGDTVAAKLGVECRQEK